MYTTSSDGFDEPGLDPAEVTVEPPAAPPLSQASLGARARDGDVDAFERLLRQHEAELFRLAFRMLGSRDEAQEVVVSTLLEGWRRLPVSPRSMSFRIWMTRTAMRQCLQALAQRSPEVHGGRATAAPVADDSVSLAGHTDLDAALDSLPAAQRACWVLKELHGMSDADISQAMGVAEMSIGGRVTAARLHLVTSLAA